MGAGAIVGVLAWLLALTICDIRERRLPDTLTLSGAAVVLAVAAATGRGLPAACGAVALFAVYLSVYLLAPGAMGGGDVKLAAGLGALTGTFGVDVWVLAAVGAPVLTAGLAVVASVARRAATVPHGPSMCLASGGALALTLPWP